MSRPNRVGVLGVLLVAGGVGLPPAASADDPAPAARTAVGGKTSSDAVVRGHVTNAEGAPLADVRVRVAVPAADMRSVDDETGHVVKEARTDADGNYRLELAGIAERTPVSLDAMKPGYRKLSGTFMAGGDARVVAVEPGKEAEADLGLVPSLYVAGVVADERGRPIPDVKIFAGLAFDRGSGGIESTTSHPDGTFAIFGYPLAAQNAPLGKAKGIVSFSHPDYIGVQFGDLYALDPGNLKALKIFLETGHRLSGTVVDAAGVPVPNARVKAVSQDGSQRKAVLTDRDGKFALRGFPDGLTTLAARALDLKQKAEREMVLRGDEDDLVVRLQSLALPAGLETRDVLGMKLADVTPELKSAYDLYHNKGAVILDPGRDSDRLAIGRLAEGDVFWMVGETRVGGVREFVDQILAETAGQVAQAFSVRVVYGFERTESEGSNTQYLTLTNDDLKQLQDVSDRLKAQAR